MRIAFFIALMAKALSAQTPPSATYTPLTFSQRWEQYRHDTFLSPGLYFAALGYAGGAQLYKRPPEWGQGLNAYEKRAGTFLATYAIQYSVRDGAAAAMGYDARYLRCECTGGGRRLAHALLWSFLTKNEAGRTRLNIPMLVGDYAGEMIPYLWFPKRYSPLKDGFRDGSQEVGITVGLNLFREFAPELRRLVRAVPNP